VSQSLTASSGATSQCQKKPSTGSSGYFPRGATDTVVYLKSLRGIGVGATDTGFQRIATESSPAAVRWFRGGLSLDTSGANQTFGTRPLIAEIASLRSQ
jgi:hypothetical protein